MADNIAVTPGTGPNIATDEVTRNATTEHQQIIKIGLGAEGAHDLVLDSGQQAMAASLPVVIASNQSAITIADGGGAITVDGTVAATQSGTWNITNVSGTVSLPTGAATSANQSTEITALQLIDDTVHSGDATIQKYNLVGAAYDDASTAAVSENNAQSLRMSQRRALYVEPVSGGVAFPVSGDIANDAADSGNPVKIGAVAYNQDGTAPGTAVAEADRVAAIADVYGRQFVSTDHPYFFNVTALYASAQTNTVVKAAVGSGLSIYITDIVVSTSTAGTANLVEDPAGTPVVKVNNIFMANNGGAVMNFRTPIKLTANKALGITTSISGNHSVTVSGYVAP